MALAEETEMGDTAVDTFLGKRETGVLSMARGDNPYAIPISYGFDEDRRTFYFRLVSTPDSEKRAFLESNPAVRLVVYDQNERGTEYWSVVVSGELEHIDPDELTVEDIEQYGRAKRPLFEIWGQEKTDLDIGLYQLRPEEISGRHTEILRE